MISGKNYQKLIGTAQLHYFEYKEAIKILQKEDYFKIKESGKMFIRKVCPKISDELIEQIEKDRSNKGGENEKDCTYVYDGIYR